MKTSAVKISLATLRKLSPLKGLMGENYARGVPVSSSPCGAPFPPGEWFCWFSAPVNGRATFVFCAASFEARRRAAVLLRCAPEYLVVTRCPDDPPEPRRPRGIQLRRTRGWRLPPLARVVDRHSIYGNPWKVGVDGDVAHCWNAYRAWLTSSESYGEVLDARRAKLLSRLGELRGRDLGCWCPLAQPFCHRNVLLELANQ